MRAPMHHRASPGAMNTSAPGAAQRTRRSARAGDAHLATVRSKVAVRRDFVGEDPVRRSARSMADDEEEPAIKHDPQVLVRKRDGPVLPAGSWRRRRTV